MSRALIPFAAVMILAAIPSLAQAQRGARGTVNTPYGSFSASEMRAAGGNPVVAEEIREQKQMNVAQRQIYRQQQQIMQQMSKQQKARQNATKTGSVASKNASAGVSTPPPTAARSKNATAKGAVPTTPKDSTSTSPKTSKPATPHVPGAPVD